MPVHPTYIPRNPDEGKELQSSIQVLRTTDNAPFLASRIPDVRTKDAKLSKNTVEDSDSDTDFEDEPDSDEETETYNTRLTSVILPYAAPSLSRLLNHPNIISLVDIVHTSAVIGDSSEAGEHKDLTIWEDMDAGCLSYLIPSTNSLPDYSDTASWRVLAAENTQRFSLPEALCWHVLRSISKALLWLHHGIKETEGIPGEWERHDEDWHPVLIMDVSPGQIWFKKPDGKKGVHYGECKLGGFQWAKVCSGIGSTAMQERIDPCPIFAQHYWAPEIYQNTHPWTRAAEIWSLGAVIYTMMTGIPPPRLYGYDWQVSRMNDKEFSDGIRSVICVMLQPHPGDRPDALQLCNRIDTAWRYWRANTKEGLEYVDKEDELALRALMTTGGSGLNLK